MTRYATGFRHTLRLAKIAFIHTSFLFVRARQLSYSHGMQFSAIKRKINSTIKRFPFADEIIHCARRGIYHIRNNPVQQRIAAMAMARRTQVEKHRYRTEAEAYLRSFLTQSKPIDFTPNAAPEVDIILILYNQAALTLACLRSLSKNLTPFHLIIYNNNSTDETANLLERISGATIINDRTNIGFLQAVNRAARKARTPAILLLNNDTIVPPRSIAAALDTLHETPDHGAVGAKLILPGGVLQEAGSIIWNNGSCLGYGRGDNPWLPEYNFRRQVDYCSAAFLLVRRELFERLGGFDDSFAPAYYEETDLCVRIWETGYKVIYEPRTVIHHFEFASSTGSADAIAQQKKNRALFSHKHTTFLQGKLPPAPPIPCLAAWHKKTEKER